MNVTLFTSRSNAWRTRALWPWTSCASYPLQLQGSPEATATGLAAPRLGQLPHDDVEKPEIGELEQDVASGVVNRGLPQFLADRVEDPAFPVVLDVPLEGERVEARPTALLGRLRQRPGPFRTSAPTSRAYASYSLRTRLS